MTSLASIRRMLVTSGQSPRDDVAVEELPVTTRGGSASNPGRWRAGRAIQLAAVIPFAVAAALYMVPGYYDRLFVSPPDMLGIPFGFVLQAGTLTWATLGATVVWQTRFRLMAALALTACTIPAVAGVVLAPTLIAYMQNLG